MLFLCLPLYLHVPLTCAAWAVNAQAVPGGRINHIHCPSHPWARGPSDPAALTCRPERGGGQPLGLGYTTSHQQNKAFAAAGPFGAPG
jgi:hypothetical protein